MPSRYNQTVVAGDNVQNNHVDNDIVSSDGIGNLHNAPRPHGAHLYVIESEAGLVKIGRSNNPQARCSALQTGSGLRLRIAKVLKNRGHEERAIHSALKAHRKNGEWFHDTGEFRGDLYLAIGEPSNFRRPCVSTGPEPIGPALTFAGLGDEIAAENAKPKKTLPRAAVVKLRERRG